MNISFGLKQFTQRLWQEQDGVLTFEWVLLVTLLAIGIVGGVSSVRDAIISELGDVAAAVVHINQSYTVLEYNNESEDCPITAPGWQCPDEPDFADSCRPNNDEPPR
jgi:Flp pilus assembly pilin Flp